MKHLLKTLKVHQFFFIFQEIIIKLHIPPFDLLFDIFVEDLVEKHFLHHFFDVFSGEQTISSLKYYDSADSFISFVNFFICELKYVYSHSKSVSKKHKSSSVTVD